LAAQAASDRSLGQSAAISFEAVGKVAVETVAVAAASVDAAAGAATSADAAAIAVLTAVSATAIPATAVGAPGAPGAAGSVAEVPAIETSAVEERRIITETAEAKSKGLEEKIQAKAAIPGPEEGGGAEELHVEQVGEGGTKKPLKRARGESAVESAVGNENGAAMTRRATRRKRP
jgi:hypothetical protein